MCTRKALENYKINLTDMIFYDKFYLRRMGQDRLNNKCDTVFLNLSM